MLPGVGGNDGAFHGLGAADPDAGEDEPWDRVRPVRGVLSEAEVGDGEGAIPTTSTALAPR